MDLAAVKRCAILRSINLLVCDIFSREGYVHWSTLIYLFMSREMLLAKIYRSSDDAAGAVVSTWDVVHEYTLVIENVSIVCSWVRILPLCPVHRCNDHPSADLDDTEAFSFGDGILTASLPRNLASSRA